MKNKSNKNLKLIAVLCWLSIMTISVLLFCMNSSIREKKQALDTARAFFQMVVISRSWNASHGGVYVPVTSKTKPNKYLPKKGRDLVTVRGLKLTKINPAYMTRQIAELAVKKDSHIQMHITSLKPIRPENKPTELERKWLKSFEFGLKEQSEFFRSGDINWFRYMAPLYLKEECLKCHAKQGYKVGDIRGGLSVSIPYNYNNHMVLIANFCLLTILGIIFILAGVNLYEQKRRLFEATFNSPMPVCVTSTDYKVLVANESYQNVFGPVTENQEPIKCYDHRLDNFCYTDECTLNIIMNKKETFTRECYKEVDGVTKHFIVTASPLFNSKGKMIGYVGCYQDITKRKQIELQLQEANKQLETLSITDGLTGIANRRHFDKLLSQEYSRHARSGAELSLIMLDIDYFKLFNDCYGHVEGDKCLKKIAHVVANRAVRQADLAARYGGEEFVCILPETGADGALLIADGMRNDIKGLKIPHKDSKVGDYVTASFGVLTSNCSSDKSSLDLLKHVDGLLYKAKELGRDRIEFTAPLDKGGRIKRSLAQLVWQESYQCGNPLIDSQHREIFNLSNELLESIFSGQPREDVFEIITKLMDSTQQHFKDEEKILKSVNYPELDKHSAEHEKLIKQGKELVEKFKRSSLSIGEAFEFIASKGIMDHMLKLDRKFYSYIKDELAPP